MRKKILTLTFIIALFLFPIIQVAYSEEGVEETEDKGNIDPDVFNMIKLRTRLQWEETQQFFGDTSELAEPIQAQLQHALEAIEAGDKETDLQASGKHYLRAMNHMRNAMRKNLQNNPDFAEILVNELEDQNTNEEESIEDADLPGDLKQQIEEAKAALLLRFQERFRGAIEDLINDVETSVEDLSPGDANKLRNALMRALQKMLRFQERYEEADYDGAIDELEDTSIELDEEIDTLEDEDAMLMFKQMRKLRAKIGKLEEIRERKVNEGQDTSGEDSLIDQLIDDVNDSKNKFKLMQGKGKGNSNNQGKGNNNNSN
ncbi:MAG: hypothetical protein ACXABJ_07350 [Candidatus Heimdallarchaeaceae archaeon]|jgi:hypothetical protein